MPWPKCYPPCVVLDLLAVSFLFARPPSLAVVNACFWYEIVSSFSFGQICLSPPRSFFVIKPLVTEYFSYLECFLLVF